ncbi:MAG TPA: winged helix DNA-binding domain-containing protein [Streptosporangiaceae bacterium]|jgi:hypothetical protein
MTSGDAFEREQVLAYRVAAQELDRPAGRRDLAVLDLGLQDTPYGTARLALTARTSTVSATGAEGPAAEGEGAAEEGARGDGDGLALVWAARGAPHLHRRADLPALTAALWPLSDADATARINSGQIKEGARLGLAAFTATAEAMRAVVTAPMPKGEVSTAVSARVAESLTYWCGPCQAQHISGGLFQQAGLAAGVEVVPRGSGTTLAPLAGRPGIPERASGAAALVRTYLRLLGPAGPAEVASYLGTTAIAVRQAWPDGLVEVRVDGRRRWLPADRLDALRSAPPPHLVRLLPPYDPYLQARDRELLVPAKAHRAEVWRSVGKPGVLLVDGEIAGFWRVRAAGRTAVEITVTGFAALAEPVRAAVEDEAGRVATVRGATKAKVRFAAGT